MAERDELLLGAVEAVLAPLARLCVAHGLGFDRVDDLFKLAFVRAAREAAGQGGGRDVSRVSVATGLSRREVTRLSGQLQDLSAPRPSAVGQLQARWMTAKRLQGPDGRPRPLPRTGKAPSFESLALSITKHVHPRSLLEELLRLQLARLSEDGETVHLEPERVSPTQDDAQMFGFLGANVGDHLAAATANVVHRDRRHVEQAIYADELSVDSVQAINDWVRQRWTALRADLIPEIERLIAADQAAGRPAQERARIGLFTYHEPEPPDVPAQDP